MFHGSISVSLLVSSSNCSKSVLAFWNHLQLSAYVSRRVFCLNVFVLFTGRTGRYTLVEKWRDTERHLAPHESPVASLNTWGQYAGDVQLILLRTGPSLTERPPSEGPPLRGPERGLYRQSLPPLAKLRYPNDRSLRRREPRRKSLTFTGAPRSLRDILSGGRIGEAEGKRRLLMGNGGHPHHAGLGFGTAPAGLWACRMEDLVSERQRRLPMNCSQNSFLM